MRVRDDIIRAMTSVVASYELLQPIFWGRIVSGREPQQFRGKFPPDIILYPQLFLYQNPIRRRIAILLMRLEYMRLLLEDAPAR